VIPQRHQFLCNGGGRQNHVHAAGIDGVAWHLCELRALAILGKGDAARRLDVLEAFRPIAA